MKHQRIPKNVNVEIITDGNCQVCKIGVYDGSTWQTFGMNVDSLPRDRYEWFIRVMEENIQTIYGVAFERGRKTVQFDIVKALGIQ